MRKTLCLPFLLHSLWSLSLLILCIQNHPRAKICLLVLEPPPNLKPADGCNVLHVDTKPVGHGKSSPKGKVHSNTGTPQETRKKSNK